MLIILVCLYQSHLFFFLLFIVFLIGCRRFRGPFRHFEGEEVGQTLHLNRHHKHKSLRDLLAETSLELLELLPANIKLPLHIFDDLLDHDVGVLGLAAVLPEARELVQEVSQVVEADQHCQEQVLALAGLYAFLLLFGAGPRGANGGKDVAGLELLCFSGLAQNCEVVDTFGDGVEECNQKLRKLLLIQIARDLLKLRIHKVKYIRHVCRVQGLLQCFFETCFADGCEVFLLIFSLRLSSGFLEPVSFTLVYKLALLVSLRLNYILEP